MAIWLEGCRKGKNKIWCHCSNDRGTRLEEMTTNSFNIFQVLSQIVLSPVWERMRHSGRDRLVGPKQLQVPSRQRENREQSETWRKKFLASTKCIISKKGGNTKAFQYISEEQHSCSRLTGWRQEEGWQGYFPARLWRCKQGGCWEEATLRLSATYTIHNTILIQQRWKVKESNMPEEEKESCTIAE